MSAGLCVIDMLPAGCSVSIEAMDDKVRFRATKPDGSESEWSGWFDMADRPIKLAWSAFEFA